MQNYRFQEDPHDCFSFLVVICSAVHYSRSCVILSRPCPQVDRIRKDLKFRRGLRWAIASSLTELVRKNGLKQMKSGEDFFVNGDKMVMVLKIMPFKNPVTVAAGGAKASALLEMNESFNEEEAEEAEERERKAERILDSLGRRPNTEKPKNRFPDLATDTTSFSTSLLGLHNGVVNGRVANNNAPGASSPAGANLPHNTVNKEKEDAKNLMRQKLSKVISFTYMAMLPNPSLDMFYVVPEMKHVFMCGDGTRGQGVCVWGGGEGDVNELWKRGRVSVETRFLRFGWEPTQ